MILVEGCACVLPSNAPQNKAIEQINSLVNSFVVFIGEEGDLRREKGNDGGQYAASQKQVIAGTHAHQSKKC